MVEGILIVGEHIYQCIPVPTGPTGKETEVELPARFVATTWISAGLFVKQKVCEPTYSRGWIVCRDNSSWWAFSTEMVSEQTHVACASMLYDSVDCDVQ